MMKVLYYMGVLAACLIGFVFGIGLVLGGVLYLSSMLPYPPTFGG